MAIKNMADDKKIISVQRVQQVIYFIRGQRVMLDSDLAAMYGVETFNLNKAVKRNSDRFPPDFMFQLTKEEVDFLRFQNGMSKTEGRGGRRYHPHAFTEQGVAMLSSVLKSKRAIQVNVAIMRAFVRFREALSASKVLALKLAELEKRIASHDKNILTLFGAIRELMTKPETPSKPIGFQVKEPKTRYVKKTNAFA
jgi:hypothetical protein